MPKHRILISPDSRWSPVSAALLQNGVARQRFKKELFKVGHYEQGDGSTFDITAEQIRDWADVTMRMIGDGIRVPFSGGPIPHEDVSNPENSAGIVQDVFVEGDSLYGIIEVIGEDNIEHALKNDVSIYSPPEFIDGRGRTYIQPITHVAITPEPLVPGLGEWQALAASLTRVSASAIPYSVHGDSPKADRDSEWDAAGEIAGADVEQLRKMCAWVDSRNEENKGAYKLPHHTLDGNRVVWRGVVAAMTALLGGRGGVDIPSGDKSGVYEHLAKHYRQFEEDPPDFKASHGASQGGGSMWKKIAKALGLSDEDAAKITPENAEDKITAAIKKLKELHQEALKEAKKASVKASIDSDEVQEEIKKQVDQKTDEIKASLSGANRTVDPAMVGLIEDNRKMKLDALVSAGRITPNARKKLEERFGTKDAIAASLKKGDSGESFDLIADVLKENDPIILAEQTGAQVIKAALHNQNKGETKDEDNPLLKDADKRAALAASRR